MGVAGLSEHDFFLERSLFFFWPTGRAFAFKSLRLHRLDAAWRLALEVFATVIFAVDGMHTACERRAKSQKCFVPKWRARHLSKRGVRTTALVY